MEGMRHPNTVPRMKVLEKRMAGGIAMSVSPGRGSKRVRAAQCCHIAPDEQEVGVVLGVGHELCSASKCVALSLLIQLDTRRLGG